MIVVATGTAGPRPSRPRTAPLTRSRPMSARPGSARQPTTANTARGVYPDSDVEPRSPAAGAHATPSQALLPQGATISGVWPVGVTCTSDGLSKHHHVGALPGGVAKPDRANLQAPASLTRLLSGSSMKAPPSIMSVPQSARSSIQAPSVSQAVSSRGSWSQPPRLQLHTLDLSNNELDQSAAAQLAAILTRECPLETLILAHNNLQDAGVCVIAAAAGVGRRVKRLDVGGNAVGVTGCAAVASIPQLVEAGLHGGKVGWAAGELAAAARDRELVRLDLTEATISEAGARELLAVVQTGCLRVNCRNTGLPSALVDALA
mmetsp:Transcript_16422/g.36284  ORF Transcript_16422/g.36284 Transcript_16422/m.36284 type:complete len:319 (+) Transcript_16422:3-959(+)